MLDQGYHVVLFTDVKKLGLPGKAEELQKLSGKDAAKLGRCALCLKSKPVEEPRALLRQISSTELMVKKFGLPGKAEELQKLVSGGAAKLARCGLSVYGKRP